MPFFDFHVHPGMKARLSPAASQPSPWQFIRVQAEVLHVLRLNINPEFADSLDSQASLQQLWLGGVNLIGLIVYSIESNVAKQLLSKPIVRDGHVLQLDPAKLQRSAAGNQYYAIVREELKLLLDHATPPASMGLPAGTRLKFIKSMAEYDKNDRNTIHAMLILEGAHNLFNDPAAADAQQQFFRNLDDLTRDFRLLAINPCHFQEQPMANHAFAVQLMDDSDFFPKKRGITPWGKEAILELYRRGIIIDTKHMGWFTRRELIALRSANNISLPLICSHAGVTGIGDNDRFSFLCRHKPIEHNDVWEIRFLKKWGHVNNTAYNMSTLGLYDEDIIHIIASGGMIGISLDQRIIGFPQPDLLNTGDTPCDLDYISKQEADVFFAGRNPKNIQPREEDNDEVMSFDDGQNQNGGFTETLHAHYFLNQVLHILHVAKNKPPFTVEQAMQCICLGSDLDGLVNALDGCLSAEDLPDFKQTLQGIMEKKKFWRGTGFAFGEIDVPRLLNNIFFDNAERFLRKHFV